MASLIAFVQAHMAVLVGFGVALLDLLFAVSPGLQANGILHWIYLQLQALGGKSA